MERNKLLFFFLPVLLVEMKGNLGTHFFVAQKMNWNEAQAYCRAEYTDLSVVRNPSDTEKFLNATIPQFRYSWIGLYRDLDDVNGWKWSVGGSITYSNWDHGQPNNYGGAQIHGVIEFDGKWNDGEGYYNFPFFCIKVPVNEEMKSWEEALDHCRDSQTDLISIISETDQHLVHREIQHSHFTDLVWIGLRFLGDHWLWVNGDPLVYVAWPEGGDGDHLCPLRKRCGALNKDGQWQHRDCTEKLNFLCN